jgi:hypothetical protein
MVELYPFLFGLKVKYWVEEQLSKIGIDAIHCGYTPKTDLYPQRNAYIMSYMKLPAFHQEENLKGCALIIK